MMPHKRTFLLLATAGLAAIANLGRAASSDESIDARFQDLAERYVDEYPALSPVSATTLGDHRFDEQLDQVNDEARDQAARFLRRYLAELAEIDGAQLSRANQVDFFMLQHELKAQLWTLEILQEWAWNPLIYTGITGDAIYGIMAREFAPMNNRLRSVTRRLEQFPRFFEQVRSTLDPARVPKIHAQTAIQQNRGVLSILKNMVEPHRDELSDAERQRLEQTLATARVAVEAHQRWLESKLLPNSIGEFRLGRQRFDQKLAWTLQTSMTRPQILRRAKQQVRDLHGQMYDIAREVYRVRYPYTEFPDNPSVAYRRAIIRACLEIAYAELPDRDAIVQEAERSLKLTTEFVRGKDLVTIPPDPLEIIVMPEFRRGVSLAYCDSPGVLDVGQKTFYAVAPPPKDWTEAQTQSFLREYNLRSLHNLTIHEAMPGHFLQLAHANRYPGKLRAVLSSGVFIEGWAVYSEWMMVEEGFLNGDPLMQLIVLKWYLRDVTNALLDQAVHVDGITEQEGMKLLIEEAFQEEREAAGKWKRAQLTSAQLSTYFVGYLEHVDLRREAEAAWDDRFDLKTYHDRVLSFGSPPVAYVRALMLDHEIPDPAQPIGNSQ